MSALHLRRFQRGLHTLPNLNYYTWVIYGLESGNNYQMIVRSTPNWFVISNTNEIYILEQIFYGRHILMKPPKNLVITFAYVCVLMHHNAPKCKRNDWIPFNSEQQLQSSNLYIPWIFERRWHSYEPEGLKLRLSITKKFVLHKEWLYWIES